MSNAAAIRPQHAADFVRQFKGLRACQMLDHIEQADYTYGAVGQTAQKGHGVSALHPRNTKPLRQLRLLRRSVHSAGVLIAGLSQKIEQRSVPAADVYDGSVAVSRKMASDDRRQVRTRRLEVLRSRHI